LVPPSHVETWVEYLEHSFPKATIVPFVSVEPRLHQVKGFGKRFVGVSGAAFWRLGSHLCVRQTKAFEVSKQRVIADERLAHEVRETTVFGTWRNGRRRHGDASPDARRRRALGEQHSLHHHCGLDWLPECRQIFSHQVRAVPCVVWCVMCGVWCVVCSERLV